MATKKKAQRVSKTLRQAVKESGQSLYAVAQGSGLTYPAITRFVAGDRPLTQGEIDQLCEYLGLVLVQQEE